MWIVLWQDIWKLTFWLFEAATHMVFCSFSHLLGTTPSTFSSYFRHPKRAPFYPAHPYAIRTWRTVFTSEFRLGSKFSSSIYPVNVGAACRNLESLLLLSVCLYHQCLKYSMCKALLSPPLSPPTHTHTHAQLLCRVIPHEHLLWFCSPFFCCVQATHAAISGWPWGGLDDPGSTNSGDPTEKEAENDGQQKTKDLNSSYCTARYLRNLTEALAFSFCFMDILKSDVCIYEISV
jgi:hypothetical protein